MTLTMRTLILPTALAATLVLAACSTSTEPGGHGMPGVTGTKTTTPAAGNTPAVVGTPATGAKSAADIEFATGMIPHHAQAVQMAELARNQATDAKVKALAPKIKAAQGPEIARMSGWLKGWGAPIPATAGGHEMSGMSNMGGMMSAQEMTDLGKASGSAFDRMWLQLMTRHHQGAVAMAKTELAAGTNPESKQLAQSIIDGQGAEIAQMKSILAAMTS